MGRIASSVQRSRTSDNKRTCSHKGLLHHEHPHGCLGRIFKRLVSLWSVYNPTPLEVVIRAGWPHCLLMVTLPLPLMGPKTGTPETLPLAVTPRLLMVALKFKVGPVPVMARGVGRMVPLLGILLDIVGLVSKRLT